MSEQPKVIDIESVAKDLDYPDTTFEVVQIADKDANDKCFLLARCTGEDNLKPGETFTVCRGWTVDRYYTDAKTAACVVRDLLHYVACHEVDERLTYRGALVWNPHDTWEAAEVARP